MIASDSDTLENWKECLSPAEFKALKWIVLDPTRPFCSGDLMEVLNSSSKGSARNIILELKKQGLIEIYCRSKYAFYKLKNVEKSKIKKTMTLSRMGGTGLRYAMIDFQSLLESMEAEELSRVHDVRLVFAAGQLYDILLATGEYKPELLSKDIFFGYFAWSKYRSMQVTLHSNGKVTCALDCGKCPIETSTMGFVSLGAFIGGIREKILGTCRYFDKTIDEMIVPLVDDWTVVMWHYGKDSAQEFSGQAFNVTFKMWCGLLARIYVHEQDKSRKVRFELTQTPKKTLQEIVANKLELCCGKCSECLRLSS